MDFKAQVCALCKEASQHEHVSPAVQRSLDKAAAALKRGSAERRSAERRSAERISRERRRDEEFAEIRRKRQEKYDNERKMSAEKKARQLSNEAFFAKAKRSLERRSAERRSAERRSAERRSAERRSAERRSAERRSAERRSAERRSAERRSAERRSTARRSAERRSAERRAAEKKPSVHGKSKSPERRARCEAKFPDKKCPKPKYFGPKCNCMIPKELRQPREKKKTSIDSFIAPEDAPTPEQEGVAPRPKDLRGLMKRMEIYNGRPKNASVEKFLTQNEGLRKSFERNQEPFGRRIEALEGSEKDPEFMAAYNQILKEREAAEQAWRLTHKIEASEMRLNSKSAERREAERLAREEEDRAVLKHEAEVAAREARNAKLLGKLGVKRPRRDF